MIHKVYLFCAILCFVACSSLSQSGKKEAPSMANFPDTEVVFEQFFKSHNPRLENLEELHFARKPEGWFVYKKDISNPKDSARLHQFWNAKEEKYLTINALGPSTRPSNKDGNTYRRAESKMKFEKYNFERHPYYGYNGWYNDVITHFGQAENLSNLQLEGLARAYSTKARSILRNQYGYSDEPGDNVGYEKVEKERLDKFVESHEKSITTYKKIVDNDPNYATLIGSVLTKHGCEKMDFIHTLRTIKEDQLADEKIEKNLFDPFVIAQAKNYLSSCPPNSIFISYGDGDFYPLLYVQQAEQFRTDVQVINNSLMNVNWYLQMIAEEDNSSSTLQCLWKAPVYTDIEKGTIMVAPVKDENLDLKEVLNDYANGKNIAQRNFGSKTTEYIKGNLFNIKLDKATILENQPDLKGETFDSSLEIKIDGSYLLRADFALLDWIAHYDWKRPICFSPHTRLGKFRNLSKNLRNEGYVNRLVPFSKKVSRYDLSFNDASVLENFIDNKMDFSGMKTLTKARVKNGRTYMSLVEGVFRDLLIELSKKPELEKFEKYAKQIIDIIPREALTIDQSYIYYFVGSKYYELGENEKGNAIIYQMLELVEREPPQDDRIRKSVKGMLESIMKNENLDAGNKGKCKRIHQSL